MTSRVSSEQPRALCCFRVRFGVSGCWMKLNITCTKDLDGTSDFSFIMCSFITLEFFITAQFSVPPNNILNSFNKHWLSSRPSSRKPTMSGGAYILVRTTDVNTRTRPDQVPSGEIESETGMQMVEAGAGLLREEVTSEPERLCTLTPQLLVPGTQ